MKILITAALLSCTGALAHAQDWNIRDSDQVLDAPSLAQIADGGSLTYFDDGVSLFSAGGAYSYTYANNGGTAFGRFRIETDGVICIDYRNGFSRCDKYVRSAGRLVLLTEDGERFPVKIEQDIRP